MCHEMLMGIGTCSPHVYCHGNLSMPFFARSCKTDTAPHCSHSQTKDQLQSTVDSLKSVLQHRVDNHHTPRAPMPALSTAALCTVGLAALAGAAIYATRNPRIPEGVHPVENFDLDRYLGKWYELARIEHSFERGLQRTQAEYSLNTDGSIQVTNRGFDPQRNLWKVSHGKAKPTIAPDIAALKVSFFGPFYGGYNVVALCKDYQWAMVVGSTLDYFWILSRHPSLPDGVEDKLMRQASAMGIDAQKVLWVHQDGVNPTGSYK